MVYHHHHHCNSTRREYGYIVRQFNEGNANLTSFLWLLVPPTKPSTRGDQEDLQFNMMYKWHRQNNYIIFQYNLPVHQYTFGICQKVLLFQSNRIPGACCRDTTPWAVTAHHHRKTSFREGAASDVEIGRSRWVPGRVIKMGETAAQIRCP